LDSESAFAFAPFAAFALALPVALVSAEAFAFPVVAAFDDPKLVVSAVAFFFPAVALESTVLVASDVALPPFLLEADELASVSPLAFASAPFLVFAEADPLVLAEPVAFALPVVLVSVVLVPVVSAVAFFPFEDAVEVCCADDEEDAEF